MPIHEFGCTSCNLKVEALYTKTSDVPIELPCSACGGTMRRLISASNIRMGKLFTAGGLSIQDKDGHESLGMTGEQADESARQIADLNQKVVREGKDRMTAAMEMSPAYEE